MNMLNPLTISLTDVSGGPPTGGPGVIPPFIPGAGAFRPRSPKGKDLANVFTGGPQRQFEQKLALVSALAKTDKEAARSALLDATEEFYNNAMAFASTADPIQKIRNQNIVEQALNTPALWQTVDALWTETGGMEATGVSSIIESKGGSGWGTAGKILLGAIPSAIALIGLARKPKTAPAGQPQGQTTQPPGQPTGSNVPNVPNAPGSDTSFFEKYAPWILTGVSGLMNWWGSKEASQAAKDAAEIQAKSADEATGLARDIYNRNREDIAPWMGVGRNSLYKLSDLMGLPKEERIPLNMMPLGPTGQAAPPTRAPASPGAPASLANVAAVPRGTVQLPADLEEAARRAGIRRIS